MKNLLLTLLGLAIFNINPVNNIPVVTPDSRSSPSHI
jgi:hypothetical protein